MFGLKVCIPAIVLFALASTAGYADIYQYVDENGVLHFTNVNGGGKRHRKVAAEKAAAEELHSATEAASAAPGALRRTSAGFSSSYSEFINTACYKHGVDPSLVHAIIKVESDFNPYALSRKGAMGLMQLMPQTAVELNVKNSFSPQENIDGGVKYLRYLLDRYEGNIKLALAAYNSGETSVKRWGTIPPFKETQQYVKKILALYNGKTGSLAPRYTIYVGYNEDGSLLLTDNPSNHQNKTLARKTSKRL